MERMNIDILGISDTQWPGIGEIPVSNGYMYYSGSNDSKHKYGVAIIIRKELKKSVLHVMQYTERIILLKLKSYTHDINIIQIYAPTAEKDDEEIESFYQSLEEVLRTTKDRDVKIILGDFNAKIGEGEVTDIIGKYGLGQRNQRGERLIEFCQERNMVITNTMFRLPKRRLYTWTAPGNTKEHLIRNQIDFMLVNKRYRNSITSIKTYPGADINSDHNPLVANFKVRMKKIKHNTTTSSMDTKLLKDENIRNEVRNSIQTNIQNITEANKFNPDVNEKWENVKLALLRPGQEKLKHRKQKGRKEWMTEEILDLMDKRRNQKGKDEQKYKNINKVIRNKINDAKERHMKQQCQEIEDFEKKYDMFNMHKKIRQVTGTGRKKQRGFIKDKKGNIILDIPTKLKRWEEYIRELFYDERNSPCDIEPSSPGQRITTEEIEYALKNSKDNKAVGPDQIPVELLKLIESQNLSILTDLYNTIYETGIIPLEWLKSTFIVIPKKQNAKECSEHRTLSLMSHTLKVFLKVIHNRIYKKLDEHIGESQFGFRNATGTREALFAINILAQRCRDVNVELHACFIDYEKAFDRVRHSKLISILKNKGIDSNIINLIQTLYWNQKATIRIENQTSEEIKICRGVRQGCILSPTLFNIYSEEIFCHALANTSAGVVVNGKIINNLRYADDTIIMTTNREDLQMLMNRINNHSNEHGITINLKKTKYMVISKQAIHNQSTLVIDNKTIERVTKYQYLGTTIKETNDHGEEISRRIEIARSAFIKMRPILSNKNLDLKIRLRTVRCYIFSLLLYGAESWTLKRQDMKRIEAFELWTYRRMLKISWTDKVTNKEVLRRVEKETELIFTIQRRKLEYLGHVMRGPKYEILRLIIQGKISGKRSIGRRRISWMKNLRQWFSCTSTDLFRAAISKVRIALMIANLCRETAP